MGSAQRRSWLALAASMALAGCDTLDPPDTLGRFEWAELDQPTAESSQFTMIGVDVLLLGDVNTPSTCFRLSPEYTESGSTAILRVRALLTNRPGCGEAATTYRYEAFLRDMDGMTQLRVIHAVEGEPAREYNHDLTVEG